MKFNKLSIKTLALVLFGIATTMATSIAPLTFGDTDTDEENWHYLMKFKLWGTRGISFENRPEFYDARFYDRNTNDYSGYNGVDPDTLGWVGTAQGDMVTFEKGWIDGPIIVGGNITSTSGNKMLLLTGPIRTSNGNIAVDYRGTTCKGTNQSGNCSYDKVPEIRSELKIPTLSGIDLSKKQSLNVYRTTTIKVDSACAGTGICDIFYSSIDFANGSRLVIQMPDGGRPTRIFTNKLNFRIQPEIVVSYGNGDLKLKQYEGNLLIYVNGDISFENIDNHTIMGTFISTGTVSLKSNMVYTGQIIADSIAVGSEIRATNSAFKSFTLDDPTPTLSISINAKKFKEDDKWSEIEIGLNKPTETDVSFEYCFDFYSASGVQGFYAGYQDFGETDASHKFPICNKEESEKVTIKAGDTKAAGIYRKPLIDEIVEDDEALWLQINNLAGAILTSEYEGEKGYKIHIVSNDKLPTVKSALTIDVNEDEKHTFNKNEFLFQHSTQTFASVIITSIPSKGQLLYNGTTVTKNQTIAVANLGKLTYQATANEFGKSYATFKYKVVGDGTGDNTSVEYTATVNVIPVNDKPTTQSSFSFAVNENPSKDATLGSITYSDVSNEINVDSYTFSLVSTDANYTEFSKYFVLTSSGDVKINGSQTFDYYAKNSYTVTATVKDDAKTEKNYDVTVNGPLTSKTFTITINIKNQNHAPTIDNQSFELPEKNKTTSGIVDWTSSKVVCNVTAKDIDGDNLTYKVVDSGIPFAFKNGTNSLVIADGSKLDYETKASWTFKVSVTDPSGASATATITVNLTDVNEPSSSTTISSSSIALSSSSNKLSSSSSKPTSSSSIDSISSSNLQNDKSSSSTKATSSSSTPFATSLSSTPIEDLSSNSTSGKSSSSNAKSSSSSAKTLSSSSKITSSSSMDSIGSSSFQNDKSSSSKATSSSSVDSIGSSSFQNDKSSSSKPASSSSTKAKTSSSSSKAVSSSSTKTSNGEIPDFYVKMIGPFEFEIVLDESVPSLAKKYAVMDMKGQVLSIGELNDKNALVKVPTRGAYVVKLGLSYRRINIR